MYKFIQRRDPNNELEIRDVEVTVAQGDVHIDDLVDVFADFLRGCGYRFGELEVVNTEEPVANNAATE